MAKNTSSQTPTPPTTYQNTTGYENIEVFGVREHNLKDIDVIIPRNKLVITGVSRSGKSS